MRRAWHEATAALKAFMAGPPRRSVDDVAERLAINPANVQHWLDGTRPHPKFRRALSELSGGLIVESSWATLRQRQVSAQKQLAREARVRQAALYQREPTSDRHGMSDTVEYQTWRNILSRCYYPRDTRYSCYGGRGITVCDRWRQSFSAFYEDMGPRPPGRFSIERLSNDLGYGPTNCIWMPTHLQAAHRRDNVLITIAAETLHAAEWDRKIGLPHGTTSKRWARGYRGDDLLARGDFLRRRALAEARPWRRGLGKRPTCNRGARLLFDLIVQRGLSQREAVEALGISLSGLHVWLRGKVKPSTTARERVAAWSDGAVPPDAWDAPAQEAA